MTNGRSGRPKYDAWLKQRKEDEAREAKRKNPNTPNEIIEVRLEAVDSRTRVEKFEDTVNGFFGLLAVPFDLMRSDVNGGTERTRRNKERNDMLEKFRNGE